MSFVADLKRSSFHLSHLQRNHFRYSAFNSKSDFMLPIMLLEISLSAHFYLIQFNSYVKMTDIKVYSLFDKYTSSQKEAVRILEMVI